MEINFESLSNVSGGYCELTEEMDQYLLGDRSKLHSSYRTYVMYPEDRRKWFSDDIEGQVFILRLPGATRGYFLTNTKGVIESIEFYEDSCYVNLPSYDRKMESIKEKYLGRRVVICSGGGNHMNLIEALNAAREGNFVTNEYFGFEQSLHYWQGEYYYEDGAVVSEDFLENADFAVNSNWSIFAGNVMINRDKLARLHTESNGRMLYLKNYNDCIKR